MSLFNGLVSLAREKKIDGKPAIEDASIRRGLAELEGYVKSHQYSGYLQMTKDLKGESAGVIQLMNKVNSTNMGNMAAKLAMEILGDDGIAAPDGRGIVGMGSGAGEVDGLWTSQYMSSLGVAIAGGTANIQKNVIAERGFGLPRDAAAQRSK